MEALYYCDLKAIEDYAKEFKGLDKISLVIFDRPESLKSNLGQLQKNRILGIFLWLKNTKKDNVTTNKIETEYKKFFKPISRSSISNYLNQLVKENVLKKEKVGKEVFYKIAHEIPSIIQGDPFWFVRNFCIYPVYICRTSYFARKLRIEKNREETYIFKLINYNLIKNRLKKCALCPFGIKKKYDSVLEDLEKQYITLKNLLPRELIEFIEFSLGELKLFNGISLFPSWTVVKEKIDEFANRFKKELKAQIQTITREWEINKET
ncbi:MAG: helix-turn-helix domain-containing protein [Candidatus Helarchaeota archaeon]